MPAYYRHAHPTPIREVMLTGINVPVRIGEATVNPGDLVFGDREGVYFIPPSLVQGILDRADETHIHDEWTKRKFDEGKYKSQEIYGSPRDPALKKEYEDYLAKKLAELKAQRARRRSDGVDAGVRTRSRSSRWRRLRLRSPIGLAAQAVPDGRRQTLRLHPDNPRYFLFRGKPTVVITSGEHYGARPQPRLRLPSLLRHAAGRRPERHADLLRHLRRDRRQLRHRRATRSIRRRAASSARGRAAPADGYADGGAKFDLTRFDEAYVTRLRDVLKEASARGIIVELVLFCPLYEDSMWAVSPMNPVNNVNGFPAIRREDVLTLDKSGPLLAVQEAVARHLVAAVAGFDNVYLEICNEPYATKVPEDWQRHMTTVVADAVAKLPQPVLLSQNVANQGQRVVDPHPAISIFNFHYATPPDTIAWNAHLRPPDRRQRDRLPRHRGSGLPHRRLGLHPGRRRPLQQPRLLVHGRARRRHVRVPVDAAGRRRRRAAAAARRAAPVHRSLRSR